MFQDSQRGPCAAGMGIDSEGFRKHVAWHRAYASKDREKHVLLRLSERDAVYGLCMSEGNGELCCGYYSLCGGNHVCRTVGNR